MTVLMVLLILANTDPLALHDGVFFFVLLELLDLVDVTHDRFELASCDLAMRSLVALNLSVMPSFI